jgi:hypothetical protein
MANRRVFKPSFFKRALGWGLILTFGGMALALAIWLAPRLATEPPEEIWASLGLIVFLAMLASLGAALLRSYFALNDDSIEIVRPFRTSRFAVTSLAGFGKVQVIVNLVPLLNFRLYGEGLKQVAIFPVNLADEAEVDAWFRRRLPVVIDQGSPAFPKPRYRDPQ